jgi:L-asparaginase
MTNKLHIINTGGTFNKQYNPLSGSLEIETSNKSIEKIFKNVYKTKKKPSIKAIINKDSLDITTKDREVLKNEILKSKVKNLIIIHGTDTMNKTAEFISKFIKNKNIVFVGTMKPFSIEPIEATASLMSAIGFLENNTKNNIYISMNGIIRVHNKIKKNYKKGVFECKL